MRRAPSHTSPVPNSTWFSSTTISRPSPVDGGGDADEIRQCARGDDRREILGRAALERRGAHRHAIGVGRGHREHAARELDEDAGEDGARIIARGGAQDALRRREEGAAVDAEGATVIDLRQPREVVGIVGVQRVAAGAAFERQQARARRRRRARPAAPAGGARCRAAAVPARRRDPARARRPGAWPGPRAPCRWRRARPASRPTARRSGRPTGSARSSAATRHGRPPGGRVRRSSLGQEMRTAQGV